MRDSERIGEHRAVVLCIGPVVREHATMSLDRADVRTAMETILARVSDTNFRLVGTASCVLRGISMPANDVDLLFQSRDAVDPWAASLADVGEVTDAPIWLDYAGQYFARLIVDGVTVELSTVEIEADTDARECVGSGPWVHFDLVPCGARAVPTVALELRLVTEVARRRTDHAAKIMAHFCSHPCDVALVERGLLAHSTPPDEVAALIRSLSAG